MQFRLLGPVEAWVEGRSPVDMRPRQRAVLAYLLLSANRPVRTDALIDAVWGSEIPSTAKTQIQADMSAIRRAFRLARAPEVISTERAGYRIDIAPGQLDLDEFTELTARAREALAAGDAQEATRSLGRAMALWRGPALADVAAGYVEAARAGLEEQRLAASEQLADAQLRLGRHAEVIAGLTPVVRQHPFRENACGLLMIALYRAGRQADALGVMRDLRHSLADQHGLDPGERIRDLEARILHADSTLDAPGAPPVTGGGPVPAQLPAAAAGFVGREGLLERLDAIVAAHGQRSAATVIALTGTAGVGKTALALQWAHTSWDRFPDGQLFLNLHGYSVTRARTALDGLGQLLRALGMPPDRVPLDVEEASAAYRTLLTGRRMLVILDNCLDSQQVRPLLPGHRDCVTVVTSRDILSGLAARDGVTRLAVDVLPPEDSQTLLSAIVGADRTAAEPQAAQELAQLCGHLPLALRVAGTRLADQPARRIGEDVDRLREGNRLVGLGIEDDRQASVAAAFELSYLSLDLGTRRVFRLLSLAPGQDFTAEAAAALADVEIGSAASALATLAAAHLVETVGPGRYAFHNLVRLYAFELNEEEERDRALERVMRFYLDATTTAVTLLYPQMLRLPGSGREPVPFIGGANASAWLDAERPNLVAAVRHAAETGLREPAWSLADALRGYFFATMYTVDWAMVARDALAAARLGGHLPGQAAAHISLGGLHWRQGRYEDALLHHKAALQLAAAAGWAEAQAASLGNIGTVYAERGQLDEAVNHVRQALAVNERLGWRQGQAVNHLNLGLMSYYAGHLEAASEHYLLAREHYRELKSVSGEAICGTNLGEMRLVLGEPEAAQALLEEALDRHRSVGDRANEAETLRCLAAVKRDTGRLADALRLAEEALTLARQARHARFEIETIATIGLIRYRMGSKNLAIGQWLEALRLARQTGNHFTETQVSLHLAEALGELDFPEQAQAHAGEALSLARRYGFSRLEAHAVRLQPPSTSER